MRLLLAALAIGAAVSASSIAEGSIEDFVDHELPASGAPGFAYAVVIDGEITTVQGHGVVEQGADAEVTADTPFLTGSIAKGFTSLAVMQLVEAGEVGLETGVSHYLDDFSHQPAGDITVRQLLSHTSGLLHPAGQLLVRRRLRRGRRAGTSRRRARDRRVPAHGPGDRWEYSNANYLILGRLVEVVGGRSYQDYVTDHILKPIGMDHMFVADGEPHDTMATGHTPWFGTKRPIRDSPPDEAWLPPAGSSPAQGIWRSTCR